MFAAVVTIAETAVPDDALGGLFAVLVGATGFLGGHAAEERKSDVDGGRRPDVEGGERGH